MLDPTAIARAAAERILDGLGLHRNDCDLEPVTEDIAQAMLDCQAKASEALLEALRAWDELDQEATDKHPHPDLTLRVMLRKRARELTPAALAPYKDKP